MKNDKTSFQKYSHFEIEYVIVYQLMAGVPVDVKRAITYEQMKNDLVSKIFAI